MAMIGYVKELLIEDGHIVAAIETGSGLEVTGTIGGLSGIECHPIVGDAVLFERTGSEIVVIATIQAGQGTATGETILFSRKDGSIVAKVLLKSDGSIEASNDNGAFKLAANGQFSANNNFTVDP